MFAITQPPKDSLNMGIAEPAPC